MPTIGPAPRRVLSGVTLAALAGLASPAALAQLAPEAWDQSSSLLLRSAAGHEGCGKACLYRGLLAAGRNPDGTAIAPHDNAAGGGSREASSATDLLHCTLDIELFPSTEVITGTNVMTVRSTTDNLTQFTIRLRSNFNVTTCKVDGVTCAISTPGSNSYGRVITLPHAYNADDQFTVEIGYTGTAVSRGFGSIEFTTLNGQAGVFTLSEAYYAGTWWPVKDGEVLQPGDNSDKFTMQMNVVVPTAMTVASNGVLQGIDTLSGNRRKHRWASNYKIAPYLVSIGATTYNKWTRTWNYPGGSMPVEFYISPGSDTSGNRTAWEKCLQMLTTFEPVYGRYPFVNEKYGMYQFTFGGGMEHQTITGMGGFGESTTAHELAHQWWGDNVTCKTWNHIWLNEGFATYGEALWLERRPGSSGLPALHSAMADRRFSDLSNTVYVDDASDMNRIFSYETTYLKGGWVLHMLRHTVGDATFFDILAAYRAQYQGSAATTEDFFAVASSVSGRDLSGFRDAWIYDNGAPAYQYAFQNVNVNGQDYLRLYLRQSQSTGYPTFPMPIDVRVNTALGPQTYVIDNDARTEHFVIPVHAPATGIVLDESNWIFNTGKSSVAFVQGPPKVVEATPAPGVQLEAPDAPSAIEIFFSENVTASASDFVVTRDGNNVPFSFTYNAAQLEATLDTGALTTGAYQVRVKSTVRSATGAIALDGEVTDASDPASLPSGDGVTGGDAVFTFEITNPCLVDFDQDGFVTGLDFDAFVYAFEAGELTADFDGDGFITGLDFDTFVGAYEVGC